MPIDPSDLSSLAADYAKGMTRIRGRRVQRLVRRKLAGATYVLVVEVGAGRSAILGLSESGAGYVATDGSGRQASVIKWLQVHTKGRKCSSTGARTLCLSCKPKPSPSPACREGPICAFRWAMSRRGPTGCSPWHCRHREPMREDSAAGELGFTTRVRKDGGVEVFHRGKLACTLGASRPRSSSQNSPPRTTVTASN